jgi:MFS family permease
MNAFDMPIRQSFVVEVVGNRKNLKNAISLNSFMFNGARLVGPSIAGVLIGITGEGTCFLLNGFSFLAVIAALLRMKMPLKKKVKPKAQSFTVSERDTGMRRGFFPFGISCFFSCS